VRYLLLKTENCSRRTMVEEWLLWSKGWMVVVGAESESSSGKSGGGSSLSSSDSSLESGESDLRGGIGSEPGS
jgi:hypothetical protein